MWVKICGTTNLEDAQLAADSGADAVGFVFAASKRQVTPQQVAAITPHLPATLEKVGVFSTQDAAEIIAAAELAHLNAVQLHAAFLPALVHELKVRSANRLRILQVVTLEAGSDPHGAERTARQFEGALRSALSSPQIDAVLLDTSVGGASGGTGVPFDWARAAEVCDRVRPTFEQPRVILAGGLRPENVANAIRTLHPWGVDVVSGVEASPGRKDPERVRAFIHAARST